METEGKSAKREAQVDVAMQNLGRAIESIDKGVEALGTRVGSVLRPEVTEAKGDTPENRPAKCPLSEAITSAAEAVARIDCKLGNLTSRIEL